MNKPAQYVYYCVCEGENQERLYLDRLEQLLKTDKRIVIFEKIVGHPKRINTFRARKGIKGVLFDHDGKEKDFESKLLICAQADNPKDKDNRTYAAYSNLNFDLWFILHKEDFTKSVNDNAAYHTDLRRIFDLPERKYKSVKSAEAVDKICEQITLDDVKDAVRRAKEIRRLKLSTDQRWMGKTAYYHNNANPDFSVHKFLEMVFKDCGVR